MVVECYNSPQLWSSRGYKPSQFIMSLIVTFHGGGKKLRALREIILKNQPRVEADFRLPFTMAERFPFY
jgi:hypothetical protein